MTNGITKLNKANWTLAVWLCSGTSLPFPTPVGKAWGRESTPPCLSKCRLGGAWGRESGSKNPRNRASLNENIDIGKSEHEGGAGEEVGSWAACRWQPDTQVDWGSLNNAPNRSADLAGRGDLSSDVRLRDKATPYAYEWELGQADWLRACLN